MEVRRVDRVRALSAESWDALSGEDDPFVEHAFLDVLEESGVVGGESGWSPTHVTIWDDSTLVGALPTYVKEHSFGEFIFDWAWANASEQLGIRYYPKVVSMIPVTPITGQRFLVRPGVDRRRVVDALVGGALEATRGIDASSFHLLFVSEEERSEIDERHGLAPRLSYQFHWRNEGYRDFDDFLGRFRSPLRKQVRKERQRVRDAGLVVEVRSGTEISDEVWAALPRFYRDTCARKGSPPYLTKRFFELARERLAHRAVVAVALHDGTPVAASLNFEKGKHLYGRYWGCSDAYDSLHFELCYYRLIERAIEKGMSRFEAGAQGIHKLRRGLMPSPIYSYHWIRHPVLREVIAEYLPREARRVREEIAELGEHGPFHRSSNAAERE